MTYEYKYLTNEQKADAIKMRQKINESDLYDFQLHLAELNLAEIKDQTMIDEFISRINDKIAQNLMLEGILLELNAN